MSIQTRSAYADVGSALPGALLVWRLGTGLLNRAEDHPAARRWARIGAAAAWVAGIAALAVALSNAVSRNARLAQQAETDDRLDEELMESFPASDPPAMTRA
jgi:hypothetical protein